MIMNKHYFKGSNIYRDIKKKSPYTYFWFLKEEDANYETWV